MAQQSIVAKVFNKKGQLLAIGRNSYTKTHPMQAAFAKQVGHPQKCFLHAEIDALRKLRLGSKPYRMLIQRTRKNGELGNAKPCEVCRAAFAALFPFMIVEHS